MADSSATMKVGDLVIALKRTIPFAASDDDRPSLHGVSIQIGDGYVRFAGTNGFALAVQRSPATSTVGGDDSVLHLDDAKALLKALPKGKAHADEPVVIEVTAAGIRSTVENVETSIELLGRQAVGTFPSYEQLIPGKYPEGENHGGPVAVDGRYLALAGKAAVSSESGIVRWYSPSSPGSPVVVHISDSAGDFAAPCTIVIMPMFVDKDTLDREIAHTVVMS